MNTSEYFEVYWHIKNNIAFDMLIKDFDTKLKSECSSVDEEKGPRCMIGVSYD